MSPVSDDRVTEALRLLLDLARDRVDRHPLAHLLPSAGGRLDLGLALPLSPHEGALEETAQRLADAIDRGVAETLAQAAVFRPGRVFCLRCQSAECEHTAPRDSREIFASFGATGAPRFLDFGKISGAISIGIPIAVATIFLSWVLTGIYIYWANSKYDVLVKKVKEKIGG